MSISFEQLKEEAAKLSDVERAELALAMVRSLDRAENEADVSSEESERAWLEECLRRDARLKRGEAHMIDGDAAIARLRQRLG